MIDINATLKSLNLSTKILVFTLGAQLILAAGLYWRSGQTASFQVAHDLVNIDSKSVDQLLISDGSDEVTLLRENDGWTIAGDSTLPADANKISSVLDNISNLSAGMPVASKVSSQAQLEVADDKYQRRLELKSADKVVSTLLFGTSPGFRKSHVRKPDDEAIYAVKINVFDLSLDHDEWLDKQLLQFNNVSRIKHTDFELIKNNDIWEIESPAEKRDTHSVDAAGIEALVQSLENLQVLGSADTDDSGSVEDLKSVDLTIGFDTETVSLTLQQQDANTTINRSDKPGRFKVSSSVFEAMAKANVDALIVEKKSDSDEINSIEKNTTMQ